MWRGLDLYHTPVEITQGLAIGHISQDRGILPRLRACQILHRVQGLRDVIYLPNLLSVLLPFSCVAAVLALLFHHLRELLIVELLVLHPLKF